MMQKIEYKNSFGFPPTICIQLLKWCNLTCSFCRAGSSPFEKEKLEYEDVAKLLTDLSMYGKWRISITGGEPLFWKDIEKLIKLIYELDFPFSLTTNGNSTENVLKGIPKEYWKNGTLHVSLDGNKDTHNLLRGEGTFEKSIFFLKEARNHVPKLFVTSVLFTDPMIWAKELFGVISEIGVNNWTIISPVHLGRWDVDKSKLASTLTHQQQFDFIKSIVDNSGNSITTYLIDFAKSEDKQNDVVFVNSDGEIRLPGFYHFDDNFPNRPLVRKSSILNSNASNDIVDAVTIFLNTQHYML